MEGASDVAHRISGEEIAYPVLAMYYMLIGDDQAAHVLVVCESNNKYRAALTVVSKGHAGLTFERVVRWISNLGSPKVISKSIQEPAITEPQRGSSRMYAGDMEQPFEEMISISPEMVFQISPVGEP